MIIKMQLKAEPIVDLQIENSSIHTLSLPSHYLLNQEI